VAPNNSQRTGTASPADPGEHRPDGVDGSENEAHDYRGIIQNKPDGTTGEALGALIGRKAWIRWNDAPL
jgi:hypothetical protein